LTQTSLQASQTTLLPSNSVASTFDGPSVSPLGQPVVLYPNVATAMQHAAFPRDTWTDQNLLIEVNKQFNQAKYNYRV